MAWTYANWQTATSLAAITAVSVSASTFTVATDKRELCAVGDRVRVDSGANQGTYKITAIAYAPDSTVVTVTPAPASAVVAGNLSFGATPTSRLYLLRLHHAEVAAAISASVAADGVSHNSETLRQYLQAVEKSLMREERNAGGMFIAGRLRS